MPKRMLQLIAGVLAVGALAVAPGAATADPSPTATMSGSGCQDNDAPWSSWGNDWYGDDDNGPYWRGWGDGDGDFGGRSWDRGCGASDSTATAARVGRVMVAVQRLRGSQCQPLSRSGTLGRTADCSGTRWLQAAGTQRWQHHIANPLPRGRYRLMHRAIDAAGNRGRLHVRRLSIR